MLPVLGFLADGNDHRPDEVEEALGRKFHLTKEEQATLLPSGKQRRFANRANWAGSYLRQAGLIESPQRGVWRISAKGKQVLAERPERIDIKFLERFPEFVEFRAPKRDEERSVQAPTSQETASGETPEELLETVHEKLQGDLQAELLRRVKAASPRFFEELVIDLLVKMGYGGTRRDAGQAIGRSGDGGIDGIIKEDALGLDAVYVQAKRWDAGTIGRPEIQKFAGALQGHRARKGVFITTAEFTQEARSFVQSIDSKIVLIDGRELVGLMLRHGVGVTIKNSYEVKQVDSDYFSEE